MLLHNYSFDANFSVVEHICYFVTAFIFLTLASSQSFASTKSKDFDEIFLTYTFFIPYLLHINPFISK